MMTHIAVLRVTHSNWRHELGYATFGRTIK